MDFVTLPYGLFVFYGALVLGCGIGLGVVMGRNWARRRGESPPPAEDLQRRVALLEEDLDLTDAALQQLLDERERVREFRSPRAHAVAA
jgi:hypothetical protein